MNKETRKKKLANKMQRYSSSIFNDGLSENLQKSISQVTNVSPEGIENRIEKFEFPDISEALLVANSGEFKEFISCYCNKSGKFLHNYSLERFADMLSIHGKEKTLSLLAQMATSNYSIEWLSTDSTTLNKLMLQDSTGYFVFAANHLFELLPPASHSNLNFSGVSTDYKNHYLRLQDKITARENLDNINQFNSKLILECNELIRRLIGLSKPNRSMLDGFFTHKNLIAATQSETALKIFIQDIKENITFLLMRHFKNIRTSIIKQQKDLYRITANDIEKIKAELDGLANFHHQPTIKKQSKRTAVLLDLKDFIIDEFGESELWDDLADFEPSKTEQKILNNFTLEGDFMGLKQSDKLPEEKPKEKLNFSQPKTEKSEIKSSGFKLSL